jgi:hypothetical protein
VGRRLELLGRGAAQVDEQRLRMQGLQHRMVDELGQRRPVGRGPCLLGQRRQQVARVVGTAKEGAVQTLHRRRPHPSADQHQQAAKHGADEKAETGAILAEPCRLLEHPGKRQRRADAEDERRRDEPAPHQQVAGAAPQQRRNLHGPVLDHGVAERHGDRKQQQDARRPQPGRQLLRSRPDQAEDGLQHDDWRRADEQPEQDHPRLATDVGSAKGVLAQRGDRQPEVGDRERQREQPHRLLPVSEPFAQPEEKVAASSCEHPDGQYRRNAVPDDEPRDLEPGQPPIERRVRGEHREKRVRGGRDRDAQQHEDGQQRAAQPPGNPVLELGHPGAGDVPAQHQRQQPRVRVLGALQQHDERDNEKGDRVERQQLLHELHHRPRVGPGAQLGRKRQVATRDELDRPLEPRSASLELHDDALSRDAVAAKVEKWLVARQRPPIERPHAVAHPEPGPVRRAAGSDLGELETPADGTEDRVDPDRHRGFLPDEIHPAHAVDGQQQAEGEGEHAARRHGHPHHCRFARHTSLPGAIAVAGREANPDVTEVKLV